MAEFREQEILSECDYFRFLQIQNEIDTQVI